MSDMIVAEKEDMSVLSRLADEAQYYSQSMVSSMFQLGRVFTQAKPLVRHGEWEAWLMENSGLSVRTAQSFMQSYVRFGGNEKIMRIEERGKIFKMLALPEGTEERFLAEHDVAGMTVREVEKAVRRAREEMGQALNAEKKARREAEERARALEMERGKVPDAVMNELVESRNTIDGQKREMERMLRDGDAIQREVMRLRKENESLNREIEEQNAMLDEAQSQYDSMRGELLTMQSMAARGDAERMPADELTPDVFAGAVRQFIGTCARMPHMGGTFSMMLLKDKNAYDELLRTVEAWAKSARAALDTADCGEVSIHG